MNKKPDISVIVPIYNGAFFVQKCIDSILNQSYRDYELLLIDDGSTDNTLSICEKYAKVDNRIKAIHQANGGVSSARNLGLTYAKGEYVTFIDVDDWVDRHYLSKLYTASKGVADLVICELQYHRNNNLCVSDNSYINNGKVDYLKHLILKGFTSVCNIMFNKRFIELNKLKFETIRYSEDFIFSMKAICLANKIVYVKEPLYYYNRENEKSAMHHYPDDMYKDLLYCDSMMIDFFKKQNLFDLLKQEMYWRVLRNKKELILDRNKHKDYKELIPESHCYINSSPCLNIKTKIMSYMLVYNLDFLVLILLYIRRMLNR